MKDKTRYCMRVRIYVRQADFKKGIRGTSHSCPVALAMQRTLGWKDVWVGPHYWGRGAERLGNISKMAALKILSHDHGLKTTPFSFCINYPSTKNWKTS